MDNNLLYELHKLLFDFIPLFQKSKTFYMCKEKDKQELLCNKNQSVAIMIIGKAKTITPTVLSKFIDLEKGSLTTLIDSLEEKDMIKRSDDPNDRRKVWISLTSKGIEQMQIIEEQSRKGLAQMISNLDENEIVEICTSLNSLTRLFRKAMEDNGQRGDSVHETTRI